MRYVRKFSGDNITVDDLLPSVRNFDIAGIPAIQKKNKFPINVDDLPIRVKTRFNGKKGNPTRRVVSTPIFDLVTPMEDMGFTPPPRHTDEFTFAEKRPLSYPKLRKRPPTSHQDKTKSLPPPPRSQMYHHHQERPSPKRQVSVPVQLLDQKSQGLHQIHDYTNIIQIYEENSPFGIYQRELARETPLSTEHKNLSSLDLTSNSSGSDMASNSSSCYSFIDSPEDDVLSVEPSLIKKRTNQDPSNFKSSLHPRDSIKYLRNYDDSNNKFEIKTKTPPVLPHHTVNVVKKDAYYKSRATFEGEPSPEKISPCNERDTAIFTRKSRILPPIPASEVASLQGYQPVVNDSVPQFHQFQSPGYTGGLRVVNRVPS